MQTLIYGRDPGDVMELALLRTSGMTQLLVTLGEREEDQLLAQGQRRLEALGMTVARVGERAVDLGLTRSVATDLGLDDEREAVVIIEIDAGGAAAAKGLSVDDIITEVDQTQIVSLDELVQSVADLKRGESALFWLWSQDRGIDVRALRIGGSRE